MRPHSVAALVLPATIACVMELNATTARAADDKVTCNRAIPYAGPAPYAGPVEWRAAPIDSAPVDSALAGRLAGSMAFAIEHTHAGVMSAAIAGPSGRWQATLGKGGASEQKLWWASVGKAFTAVVVMQLVEEGALSLTDSLARWMPGFPNARAITIDHLLQHTAGVFSANEDRVVRVEPKYRTPEDLFAVAKRHGCMSCPGHYWRYSNTGYDMLGRIIEAVEGRPYHEVVQARIVDRLGLVTMRVLKPRETPVDVAPLAPTAGTKAFIQPGWAYAAGSVVGSAADMVTFWHALLSARLLSEAGTARLFEHLYPMFDPGTFYGRGVMLYEFTDAGRQTWIGHGGGSPGIKAVAAYSPADRAFVAVALTGDGSAEATANLLLKELRAR